jgi:hypothetical protein
MDLSMGDVQRIQPLPPSAGPWSNVSMKSINIDTFGERVDAIDTFISCVEESKSHRHD